MYSVNLGGVATQSLVSIGTNISSENASIQNASVNSLSAVSFKTAVFSPNIINTSNLNVSSINLDPTFVFPVLNASTLVSQESSLGNVSAVNISANNITADNIQPLLTAGSNISILNNTISALNNNLPATANFSELNTSIINASNLSTGDLTFDSNFNLSNKFLTINSTTNVTENSGDLVTSGAVFSALAPSSYTNLINSITHYNATPNDPSIQPISIFNTGFLGSGQSATKMLSLNVRSRIGIGSYITVTFYSSYVISGNGFDEISVIVRFRKPTNAVETVTQQYQTWADKQGGGTRSGTLFPVSATFQNKLRNAGEDIPIEVYINTSLTDDTIQLDTNNSISAIAVESLNAGSTAMSLSLGSGDVQADSANFNSLTVQAGSGSGQATIGRSYLGNNAFSNMAALSVNGNDGATNYGFAQVANNQTIMNAMPSSYNSFRCENIEVASIGQIGLGIGLGIANTAVFPLDVSGDALVNGIVFASELDSNDADITNISNTNFSGTNANFQDVNVSGSLILNGTPVTTTPPQVTAGENINISNNVISAFFGSGGEINLSSIQVDNDVNIGGVLNVSQTSNFSNSVNVGDILYVGDAGNHEGSVVLYSNIVGDNLATKINSSTLEVNTSATGNLSVINFFVGNNKTLEITNGGIETSNLTTDVLTFIDGRATFRLNTPQLNASNASIDEADIGILNASVITCDVLESADLVFDVLNISTFNVSIGFGNELNTSNLNASNLYADIGNISTLTIDGTNDFPLVVPNGQVNMRQLNISNALLVEGSDMFVGSALNASNVVGGAPRSRISFFSATTLFEMGTRMGVNENNEAFLSLEPFGNVSNYTISINNFSTMNMTETDTTFNHKLNASNVSVTGSLTASNISTGSIAFSNDFNFDTFSDTLSLAVTPAQALASLEANGLNTVSVNTSILDVDGLTTLDNVAVSQSINALVANLNTINSSGTANISVINNSTLNSIKSNISIMNASNCNASNCNFSVCDVNGSFTVGNIIGGPAILSSVQSTNLLRGANASVDNNMSVAGTLRSTVVNCNNVEALKVEAFNISVFTKLTVPSLVVSNSLSLPSSATLSSGTLSAAKGNITNISNNNISTQVLTAQFRLRAPLLNVSVINVCNVNVKNNFACRDITCEDIDAKAGSVLIMPTGNFSTINASNIVGYQETLTAGSGIFINGTTISATAASLPANANFSSVTATTGNFSTINASNIVGYQETLTAGSGILINGTTISATAEALPANANFSSVNASTGNFSSIDVFQTLLATNGTVTAVDMNVVGNLNANNISGYQRTLIAGDNISILNNVISATGGANANFSSVTAQTANISSLTIDGTNAFPLVVPNGQVNMRQLNISNALLVEGSDVFVGSALNASNVVGGPPRSRINFFSSTTLFEMGTRMGVNENNEAFLSLEPFGNVNNYTININNTSVMNMTETETTFNHPVNAPSVNISNDINMGGSIITDNGVYTNYKIPIITNNITPGAVFLLCLKDGGDNECVGRMYYQRSSGHDGAGIVDIVVSSRSVSGDLPNGFCSYQTNQENSNSATPHRYSIISGTFSGVDFIGLKYEGGDAFPFLDVYFDGILKTTGTNDPFQMITNSQFTNQVVLELDRCELSLLNKSLVINNNGDVNVSGVINQTGASWSLGGLDNGSRISIATPEDDYLTFSVKQSPEVNCVFDATDNEITIQKAGKYLVNFGAMSDNNNSTIHLGLRKNDIEVLRGYSGNSPAGFRQVTGSIILDLVVGDIMSVYVYSGQLIVLQDYRHFTGHLIG